MAGYYDEEGYNSRGPPQYRDQGGAAQFDTMNLGAGPQRVAQFDTMNIGAPVRAPEPVKAAAAAKKSNQLGGGETPIYQPERREAEEGGGRPMQRNLVIASLCLRVAAVLSLIIALAVLAANSYTTVDGVTFNYSSLSATKYALAVAIVGTLYSIYELVSAGVRLGMDHLLLPGKVSLFVSYIGDQVILVLLLTGASAAAASFKDLQDLGTCDLISSFCNQGAASVAMIFLGSVFLGASLIISSFCFYKNRT